MAQVCRGLAHAHEKGVIHRDIKPTNLYLLDTGVVKVLDLGLGGLVDKALLSGDGFDTGEGVVVGTTDFMSPEQIRDQPIDVRTDLFSLGCTMYRLLAGTYAFPGLTREDRLVKRIREEHVPIRDVRPDVPSVLARIVDRLLALRPEDRFGSAGETEESLEALIPSAGRSGAATARGRRRAVPMPRSRPPHGARGAAGLVADRIGTSTDPSPLPGSPCALWTGTSRDHLPPGASPPIARSSRRRASNPGGRCTRNTATN